MPLSFNQMLNITRGGMITRLLKLDVVSNNLANSNTIGFKHSRANFQELLDAQQLEGTTIRTTQPMMEQGSLRLTNNPLDVAISGKGFFSVTLPDGRKAYTRNGEFFLDAEARIVTASGYPLVWDGELPADVEKVQIDPDGTVMAQVGGEWSQAGTIQLHKVANPAGMLSYGNNMWLATDVSGTATAGTPGVDGYGALQSSTLENSNVSLSEEMVQLISTQRSFQMNLRTFQQTDQMLSQAINMRRA